MRDVLDGSDHAQLCLLMVNLLRLCSRCPQRAPRALGAVLLCAAGIVLSASAAAQSSRAEGIWNGGASDEPVLRVRQYAPGFWVIRQGKRSNPEAPFMYLIAGRDSALLLDTGAAPTDSSALPLVPLVDSLLATVRAGPMMPLLVLHSHGHSDHRHLDAAFSVRAKTTVVAADTTALRTHFGITRWPDAIGAFDLGERQLQLIPTPGHQSAHVMVYDARTRALLSGDMLYPGLLTVRDLAAFRASAERVARFAARHQIRHILGAHVEMSRALGRMYPLGTVSQPDEHTLALPGAAIGWLSDAIRDGGDFVREVARDDFKLGRVQLPSADRASTHGMLMFGSARVYLSHLPMSRTPHDYQLVFEAGLPASVLTQYRRDVAAHPGELYSLEPAAQWVLPNTITRDTVFPAHLYRGHFERGGVRIAADVPVTVREVVMFRRFEPPDAAQPSSWFAVGHATERFLIHRIAGRGDMDQVVQLCGGARAGRDGARVAVPVGAVLRVGSRTPVGRVCHVVYTEREDLAH
jgi:glyoxylase-like metal-dependent hydrolase (beta-lactamase superfamily II)